MFNSCGSALAVLLCAFAQLHVCPVFELGVILAPAQFYAFIYTLNF